MCAQLAVYVCDTVYMWEMGILCRASEKQVEVDFWQSLLGKRHDRCQDVLSRGISLSLSLSLCNAYNDVHQIRCVMCVRCYVHSCNIAILSEDFFFLTSFIPRNIMPVLLRGMPCSNKNINFV